MRFWDASALVPLLVGEASTAGLLDLLSSDADVLVWWGTAVECVSAVARRERDGVLSGTEAQRALDKLRALADAWQEVLPSGVVRATAQRLLRVHPLRAADGLQLAAALVAAEGESHLLEFVCLDARLNEAARREGLRVLPDQGLS